MQIGHAKFSTTLVFDKNLCNEYRNTMIVRKMLLKSERSRRGWVGVEYQNSPIDCLEFVWTSQVKLNIVLHSLDLAETYKT